MAEGVPDAGHGIVVREAGEGHGNREPDSGRGGEAEKPGSFIISALLGIFIAGVGMSCLLPSTSYGAELYTGAIIWSCICCFTGGFVAGFCLRKDLRFHGWRLLWLAAVSPALLVWIFTVLALLSGVELTRDTMIAVFLACGVSVVGSISGYHFNWVWWKALFASTRFRIAEGFVVAVVAGTFSMLLPLWWVVMLSYEISTEDYLLSDLAMAIVLFILYALPLFLGGMISGILITAIVPVRRWQRVLVPIANPALPISLVLVGLGGSLFGEGWFDLAAGVAFPVLGAVAGHRYLLRRKSRPGTGSRGEYSPEDPEHAARENHDA